MVMEDLHSRHFSGCFDRNMHSCCWFIRSNFSVEAARCLPTCPKHGGWLPDGCVDPGLQEVDGLESPIHPNQSNTLLFTGQTWSNMVKHGQSVLMHPNDPLYNLRKKAEGWTDKQKFFVFYISVKIICQQETRFSPQMKASASPPSRRGECRQPSSGGCQARWRGDSLEGKQGTVWLLGTAAQRRTTG